MRSFRHQSLAATLLIAAIVGCSSGPPSGTVKGKVTFMGKPVTEGTVMLLNTKEGGSAGGDINKDGTFSVQGPVLVGDYIVVISPPVVMMDTDPGKSPPAPVEKNMPDVPKKYRQQGTTDLKATVKTGPNDFTFDMKK